MPRLQIPSDMVDDHRKELKRLRTTARITQQAAANLLDMSLQQYSKYERGKSAIKLALLEVARERFFPATSEVKGLSETSTPYVSQSTGESEVFKIRWLTFRSQLERLIKHGDELAGM